MIALAAVLALRPKLVAVLERAAWRVVHPPGLDGWRLGVALAGICVAGGALVCALAVRELGYTGVEVGRHLGLKRAGVSLAARRGEAVLARGSQLRDAILGPKLPP